MATSGTIEIKKDGSKTRWYNLFCPRNTPCKGCGQALMCKWSLTPDKDYERLEEE